MQETETTFLNALIFVESQLTGTEKQCIAVTEKLNIPWQIHHITPNWLDKICAPWWGQPINLDIKAQTLIVAAGRQAIYPALQLKKRYPNLCVVALQDPKTGYKHFDLIAAPAHDMVKKGNLIETIGAPTSINAEILEQAKNNFPDFASLPNPRVALLIGGNSKNHRLSTQRLEQTLSQLEQHNASYLITASRRSGSDIMASLNLFADKKPNRFLWNGTGSNPYHAMLAHADIILVTQDSVSMISDAASTGKAVYLIPLDGKNAKFNKFYDTLYHNGLARPYDGNLEKWSAIPLQDAAMVAQAIKSLK